MKKFNLDRLNAKMIKLGESPIKLKRTTYRGPIIKNEMLKGKDGSEVGTKGDMYHKVIFHNQILICNHNMVVQITVILIIQQKKLKEQISTKIIIWITCLQEIKK